MDTKEPLVFNARHCHFKHSHGPKGWDGKAGTIDPLPVALTKQGGIKMQKVTIVSVEGILDVRIGCQTTYFLTPEALLADLKEYLKDPTAIEERYFRYKNEMSHRNSDCTAEQAPAPVDPVVDIATDPC